jgi:hypothetical protein
VPAEDQGAPVEVELLLAGVTAAFESGFPGRLRACYLLGSYEAGTAGPTSDVDAVILFRGEFAAGEEPAAQALAAELDASSAVRLDIGVFAEESLSPIWAAALPQARRFAGDAFELPAPDIDDYAWALMADAAGLIAGIRGGVVSEPLAYPLPAAPFFGYEAKVLRLADGRNVASSKALAMIAGWSASALVALRCRRYVTTREQVLSAYSECIGDEWTALLQDIERACHGRHYLLPEDAAGRDELRELCARLLAFERHVVRRFRAAVREALNSDGPARERAEALVRAHAFLGGG